MRTNLTELRRLASPGTLFLGATAAKILRAVSVPIIVVPKGSD